MEYVIIGNGIASVGCIEGIRKLDKQGKITVVAAESRNTYCRPLISYLIQGKTDTEKMKYRPDSFYAENGCTVLTDTKAVSIEPDKHAVTLDNGSNLHWDRLCCATGSSPFVPPFEGIDTVPDKFGFMTLDDAEALESHVNTDTRVLIVGAGLIGLKCAEALAGKVKSITVCDLAPRILPSILDDACAAIVQRRIEENGITVCTADSAASFDGNTAVMKSGRVIEFDILVLAVGVRANISLVKNAGGNTDRGIITDRHMRTSLDGIYAAGDCAQGWDASIGANRVLAILPGAYMQGECAGTNMAGGDADYGKGIPMNSIGFFGLHIATAGNPTGELYEEHIGGGIKRLYTSDDRLKGFMLVGDTSRAGIYTSLIRNDTPLSSLDFELLRKSPCLAAFSLGKRSEMLGKEV